MGKILLWFCIILLIMYIIDKVKVRRSATSYTIRKRKQELDHADRRLAMDEQRISVQQGLERVRMQADMQKFVISHALEAKKVAAMYGSNEIHRLSLLVNGITELSTKLNEAERTRTVQKLEILKWWIETQGTSSRLLQDTERETALHKMLEQANIEAEKLFTETLEEVNGSELPKLNNPYDEQ